MKKLVVFAAVAAAMSLASCGNKSEQANNAEVVENEAQVTEVAPAAVDSAAVATTEVAPADSAAVEAAPAE